MVDNYFGWVDYAVVVGTLLFSVLIGLYYGLIAKQKTSEDLLVGGRNMSIIPIAISMLVTYLSAVTVLGYPAEVYDHGIQIFMNTITFVIFVPFSVYFFMTVFYKMKLTSVYEYLQYRFKSTFVRCFAAFIFCLQMSVFMGVCLYAPSIALKSFIGIDVWISVFGLGICATIYTSMGGLKAVVWTDVFQLIMMLAGLFAIIIQGFIISGGVSEVFRKAGDRGRMELFNFTIDPFMRHNTLNILLGQGFTIFCLYGTHQPQVQRYCSLPTLKHAIKATAFGIPLSVFTVGTCLLAGIVIFAAYDGCDPVLTGKIPVTDIIVPHFVKDQLGFIPGMMGLFTACVFSASLSTLSSGLNSLAAVTWEDFLAKIPGFPDLRQDVKAGIVRFLGVFYGILSIGLAFVAQHMGSILPATITALGALNGPLGAIFVMGLLMPFINRHGAITGMVGGFLVMCWLTVGAFRLGKSHIPLPVGDLTDECINGLETVFTLKNVTLLHAPIEWPEKIYTISYITYSFVGGMITFIIATVVSIITGGCKSSKDVDLKYLHPLLHGKNKLLHTANKLDSNDNYSKKHVDRLSAAFVNGSIPTTVRPYSYNTVPSDDSGNSASTPETPGYPGSPTEKPLLYRLPSYDRR